MEETPDWFWEVIEVTRPHVSRLEAWLESQPKTILERFAFGYASAASSLVDYWQGHTLGLCAGWSEDDTEDLCLWVVGQGRAYWASVASGQRAWADVVDAYERHESPPDDGPDEPVQWIHSTNPDYRGSSTPDSIADGVYWKRFGEELHGRINSAGFIDELSGSSPAPTSLPT